MLNESVCRRCFRLHGHPWEHEDWANGCVFCPPGIVARRIRHPQIRRLLGTVFGMTKITEVPVHCPYRREHEEVLV